METGIISQLCTMVKGISSVVVFILLYACTSNSSPKQEASGKELFRQNCVICHGIQGDLMTNGAKNLSLSEMALDERILVITNGRNVMTGFGSKLSTDEIQKVARYTMNLNPNIH